MASSHLIDPQYWRQRAQEVRSAAEHLTDPHAKRMLLGIGDDYERLAKCAEQRVQLPST
jgi:hypothetical protein